jgi:hypothetical protein
MTDDGINPTPRTVTVNAPPPVGKVLGVTSSTRGFGFGTRIAVTSFEPKFAMTARWPSSSTAIPNAALPTLIAFVTCRTPRSTTETVDCTL